MDADTCVKVAVRIRPLLEHELSQQCSTCVNVVPDAPQIVVGSDQNFTFDYVYGLNRKQEDVTEECVLPLVDALFEGFNATILAYGQTGSGKTYTMGSASSKRVSGENLGIIPRSIQSMFDTITDREESDPNRTFRLRVQFLEIYGEEIRDLLDPAASSKVSIRETAAGNVYVSGAREELVTTTEESMMALERGSLSRMTASTRMNETSSRSHGIFTIILEETIHTRAIDPPVVVEVEEDIGDDAALNLNLSQQDGLAGAKTAAPATVDFVPRRTEPEVRKCKFHFVDLAGSERVKRTGAEGLRLREGIDINKGLLVLGNVISALGDEQKRGKVHVPYRDSKLTRMLQDSLGGNSKTLMICCVSPADSNYYESLNALKYANRARNIQNKPRVNIDPTVQLLAELRKHVQCLANEVLIWRDIQGLDAPPVNPNSASTQTIPFTISKELLQNLATSGGGNAKMLLKTTTAPTPAVITGTGSSSTVSSPNHASKPHRPLHSGSIGSINSVSNAGPLVQPSASLSSAAEILAARKVALEHEATIFSLKQKVSDAESEVHRLTEAVRRQRQHSSDVMETNMLLQSERDYYKQKLKDAGIPLLDDSQSDFTFRDDFISEQPDSIPHDAEEYKQATSVVAGSSAANEKRDVHVVVELVARYIREIEALKSKRVHSSQHNERQDILSQRYQDGDAESERLNLSTLTSTIVGMDLTGEDGVFDSNVTMLENDLTSSVARVISQTQRELHNEQQRLDQLKSVAAENSHVGDGEIGIAVGSSIDLSDDQMASIASNNIGAEVEAQDRAFRRRQQDMSCEVIGLSNSIQLKEQLLLQLQRSQRQYEMMKIFYESKLVSLSEEVLMAETEKGKMTAELEQLMQAKESTSDKEDSLKIKLKEKDAQLKQLHSKQKELTHHSQVQSRSLNQISKLESEIEHMKRARVDVTKQIHVEKKKHLAALNQKAREIEKLKTELNKTSAEMKKVSREKERAENRTREALKEGADLRRKVHEISKLSPALASDTASSAAKFVRKPSVKAINASSASNWSSNTSYRPASRRILSEEEVKTKRYLDKALAKITEREREAEALRQQYEQQLALMNQKKQLESSRSSLRDLITIVGASEQPGNESTSSGEATPTSTKHLSAAEESALQEVEDRIQTLEGQLMSRKARIESMQTRLSDVGKKAGKGGDSDSTVEYLQKKSADSLPAAHELLRLLFDMLVASKCSAKTMSENVEKLKEREMKLKEDLEDQMARIQTLQFAHDQELTRIHSDYEEKLSGLLNYSDVNQLLTQLDNKDDSSLSGYVDKDQDIASFTSPAHEQQYERRISRLIHAASTDMTLDDHGRHSDPLSRLRSDSGIFSSTYTGDAAGSDNNAATGRGNQGQLRALLALSHEKNSFLASALQRETLRMTQLQSDLDDAVDKERSLTSQLESREFDITFLNEECRMLRDMVDEYKERLLALEGGQGVVIVRTMDLVDKQKRGEKGMTVRYGDNPDVFAEEEGDDILNNSPPNSTKPLADKEEGTRRKRNGNNAEAEDSDDNSEDFGMLTDEIMKSGTIGSASLDSTGGQSHGSGVSIFDRLANPSYFTGTQKKLFQQDYIAPKRALVKKIKKDEHTGGKRKKDGTSMRSLSDDEGGNSHRCEKEDVSDRSDDEDDSVKHLRDEQGESINTSLMKRSSFSADDLDIGTHREPAMCESHDRNSGSPFLLPSGASFERPSATPSTPAPAGHQPNNSGGGDVFSRLLNPTKYTGIHKVVGGGKSEEVSSPRNPERDASAAESQKAKTSKKSQKGRASAESGTGSSSRNGGKPFHL